MRTGEVLAALLNDYRNRADLAECALHGAQVGAPLTHQHELTEQVARYRGAVQALSEVCYLFSQVVPPMPPTDE